MNGFRDLLYRLARVMGDATAVQKGRVPRRIARRIVGRETGRFLRGIFR